MRTSKIQRTAYNLTKMAGFTENYFDLMDCGIAEIASDHGIACINYRQLMEEAGEEAEQAFVFVPQKVWDAETSSYKLYESCGLDDPKRSLRLTARHWYDRAMIHHI